MKLNIGCGYDIRPRPWINIDQYARPGVDVVTNLDIGMLPYANESVDEIYAAHILEHVQHWERLMPEFARVLEPGGKLEIRVPYRDLGAFHVRQFGEHTLRLFYERSNEACVPGQHNGYEAQAMFELISFQRKYRLLYRYHCNKYLRRDWGIPWEVNELIWELRKPVRA